MDDNATMLELIIFAAIAGFAILRLRSVLGRRDEGDRQRPNPFVRPPATLPRAEAPRAVEDAKVIALPDRGRWSQGQTGAAGEPSSLEATLAHLRALDPSFDEKRFLAGARGAFAMVVEGYAQGDRAMLASLLSPALLQAFTQDIDAREAAHRTLDTKIDAVREAEIVSARAEERLVRVAVRFVSIQRHAVTDADGVLVEGDPAAPLEVVDLWTFERDPQSRDPNWRLVEAESGG